MMRRTRVFFFLFLTMAAGAADRADDGSTDAVFGIRSRDPRSFAVRGATLHIAPGRVVADGALLVEEGTIVAAGSGVRIPQGVPVLDLSGKHVYPGFVEPFGEYGLPARAAASPTSGSARPVYATSRRGAFSWNDANHAHVDWADHFRPEPEAAEKLLRRGYTAVQSVRKDGVLRGRGVVVSLAPGSAARRVLAPGVPHASFDKGSSEQSYPSSLMGSIALLRQAFSDADWYARAHAAWRTNPGQPRPEENRTLAALAADGPILFETDDELSLLRAERIAREFGRTFAYVGSNFEYRRLERVAATGRTVVLPLDWPEAPPVSTPGAGLDVTLADLRHWERAPANPAALIGAGVEVAFTGHGLDSPADDPLARIRTAMRHGLAETHAVAALTTVPARLLGVDSRLGTLEAGKRADFFVADRDVFAAPASVLAVWIDGRRVREFHPTDRPELRGRFRLHVDGDRFELAVEGTWDRLRGRIERGKTKIAVSHLEAGVDDLRFVARIPEDGEPLRFRLRAAGRGFEGRAVAPDGTERRVRVERTGDPETPSREEREDLVSRRTRPSGAFGLEAPPVAEEVLIRNATIWTGDTAGTLETADLRVVAGKIDAVGRGLAVSASGRVIDGTGRHVTPGIIDEHSHLAISRGVNEGSHAVTSEVRIGDVLDPEDVGIYRALAGGVTTAQLLHGSANPIGGQAQIIKHRWGRDADGLVFRGAPPTIKFALGENVKQSNWGDHVRERYPQSRMGVETIIRDAFREAEEYRERFREWERIPYAQQGGKIPPRRDLALDALVEILEGKRFVHCHSYRQSEILMLMRLAESFGFRIKTFTHILEGYKVADEMARHGAGASTFSDWWAYKFEVYDAIPYNTCILHERGVVTSVNSDSGEMIRRLNQEAAKSVHYCGMDESEALRLVTANPAIQLGIEDRVGTLTPGKDADFVIWDGHPLSSFSKVEQTWIEGALYFDRERDRELREAARRERTALIAKALAAKKRGDGESHGPTSRPEPAWHCEDVVDVWK